MRSTPVEPEQHSQAVCAAIFYMFKTAPDSILIRRELLSATRYMLSGAFKSVCFLGVIPEVLQEGVLLGSHLASMETLRPLAVRGLSPVEGSADTRQHWWS
jgi:hypothetical protein